MQRQKKRSEIAFPWRWRKKRDGDELQKCSRSHQTKPKKLRCITEQTTGQLHMNYTKCHVHFEACHTLWLCGYLFIWARAFFPTQNHSAFHEMHTCHWDRIRHFSDENGMEIDEFRIFNQMNILK